MAGTSSYVILALCACLSVCAAFVYLDSAVRILKSRQNLRRFWCLFGAATFALGVCVVHFFHTEDSHLPPQSYYHLPTSLLSPVIAGMFTALSLVAISRPHRSPLNFAVSAFWLGTGILSAQLSATMALRFQATVHYSLPWMMVSALSSYLFSALALISAFGFRKSPLKQNPFHLLGSSGFLSLAILATHSFAMSAATYQPARSWNGISGRLISTTSLATLWVILEILFLAGFIAFSAASDHLNSLRTRDHERSRTELETIFERLNEGIIVINRDGRIQKMNRGAQRIFGINTPVRFVQDLRDLFEDLPGDGSSAPSERFPTVLAFNGQFLTDVEYTLIRKSSGARTILAISTAPISNADGLIDQIVLSCRDATLPVEEEESRLWLAAIIDSSEDAIIAKDMNGIVLRWNASAERIFGYSAAEIIGQSIKLLIPEDRQHEEDEILSRIQSGHQVDHIETIRRRKNGQFIHVSLTISPILDRAGKMVGAAKIVRNISDRKNMENRLSESRKMEAIGQVTGGVAHDFNNLLSIVIGNLDLLERQIADNPAALKRLETAVKAATRGADLTRRLLAFSSREDLKPSLVLIDEPIRNTLELAARVLGPEIKIVAQLDPNIPSIVVDVSRFENVLLNLFVNARDAMPGGGTLTITTRVTVVDSSQSSGTAQQLKSGRYACLTVSDNGYGMSRETMERVFEPFFTTKGPGKGTGLGLAMVYGFFRQSGGAVHIYSELGYGTSVTAYLPLDRELPKPLIIAPTATTEGPLNFGAILIVDDEADITELAAVFLGSGDLPILRAHNGIEALNILRQPERICLLITDIIMPGGINGAQLAQRARALQPDIRVIYCSGFPADALTERNFPAIDGPMLHKPYQASEFISLVHQTLRAPVQPGTSTTNATQSTLQ